MLFNSVTFILFFLWVLMVHYSPLSWSVKKSHLLLSSYLFYAAWNPPFIVLLLLSTFWDWHVANKIHNSTQISLRRFWLIVSLTLNLGLLVIFKYTGFLLENFNLLVAEFGFQWQITDPGLILPMGISFYTFQTLSYTLDVYFKRIKPWQDFRDYALFVSFFPQLVAGPIVRARDFLPQTQKQRHINQTIFSTGVALFVIGLVQKTVLADGMFAPMVDQVFARSAEADAASAWIASLLFSAQIFCDFSGYSLCAIGVAMCLGFELPINFRSPFAAIGFSDLWRRWHISLSSWLRDYLYIPLGGNRGGRWTVGRNLMLTMLLGGLWHGAAWTFVLWGGLHGCYLIAERGLKQINWPSWFSYMWMQYLLSLVTFLFVMWAFVVFRAENMQQASDLFLSMWGLTEGQRLIQFNAWTVVVLCCFVLLMLGQWLFRHRLMTEVLNGTHWMLRSLVLFVAVILLLLASGGSDAFIYFQF